jgi:hypothetical protein
MIRELLEDTKMGMVDAILAPENLKGPYAEFYTRAITELLCWRMLCDGSDGLAEVSQREMDPAAFDALGIQFGQA